MEWLEQKLIKRWPVKLLGDIDGQIYLGMDIKIDYIKKILKINQKHAIQKFLKNIDMLNCKTRSTPMDSNVKLTKIKGPCVKTKNYSKSTELLLDLLCILQLCHDLILLFLL